MISSRDKNPSYHRVNIDDYCLNSAKSANLNSRARRRLRRRSVRVQYNTDAVRPYGEYKYWLLVDGVMLYAATSRDARALVEACESINLPMTLLDPYAVRVTVPRPKKQVDITCIIDYFADFGDVSMYKMYPEICPWTNTIALDIVFLDRVAAVACLVKGAVHLIQQQMVCTVAPVPVPSFELISKPWSPARFGDDG